MDKESVEKDVIDIDSIDPVGGDSVVVITDENTETGTEFSTSEIPNINPLGTGNILSQFFKLIADIREKVYWKLDKSEIDSLNKTCPKVLPKIVQEKSGIIGCILSLLGIIIKRIKMERQDSINNIKDDIVNEESTEQLGLTGSRG